MHASIINFEKHYKRISSKDNPYKYVLTQDVEIYLDTDYDLTQPFPSRGNPYHEEVVYEDGYIKLTTYDTLTIKKGYAWDGLTFFPDHKSWLLGSLAHDALLQLWEAQNLPHWFKLSADKVMRDILKRTSSTFWATVIYEGMSLFYPFYKKYLAKGVT